MGREKLISWNNRKHFFNKQIQLFCQKETCILAYLLLNIFIGVGYCNYNHWNLTFSWPKRGFVYNWFGMDCIHRIDEKVFSYNLCVINKTFYWLAVTFSWTFNNLLREINFDNLQWQSLILSQNFVNLVSRNKILTNFQWLSRELSKTWWEK